MGRGRKPEFTLTCMFGLVWMFDNGLYQLKDDVGTPVCDEHHEESL